MINEKDLLLKIINKEIDNNSLKISLEVSYKFNLPYKVDYFLSPSSIIFENKKYLLFKNLSFFLEKNIFKVLNNDIDLFKIITFWIEKNKLENTTIGLT